MKVLTLVLASTLSFGSVASDSVEMCSEYSELAGSIMTSRQLNVSMADVYGVLKESPVGIEMLKEAYKVPLYSVESNKENAVMEFKNDIFMLCIQGREDL